jgi:hypothetical protein
MIKANFLLDRLEGFGIAISGLERGLFYLFVQPPVAGGASPPEPASGSSDDFVQTQVGQQTGLLVRQKDLEAKFGLVRTEFVDFGLPEPVSSCVELVYFEPEVSQQEDGLALVHEG